MCFMLKQKCNDIYANTKRWIDRCFLNSSGQECAYSCDCCLPSFHAKPFPLVSNYLITHVVLHLKRCNDTTQILHIINILHIITECQFSHSVMSDSLQPHMLQHARLPYPSPTPGVCSNSCPSSRWCHSTISSSAVPFASCLQSSPASGSFPIVSSSHQAAKVLELQLQNQSFQWIFRTDFL